MKRILIECAMLREADVLLEKFKPSNRQIIMGFDFYFCKYNEIDIIIMITDSGTINATMATTLAIERYQPDIIISEGSCGAHQIDLKPGKIIIASEAVYMNYFSTKQKAKGEGSDPFDWKPSSRCYRIEGTKKLVDIANTIAYDDKMTACIGSGDMFTREYDRIVYLSNLFQEVAEDMEVASIYKVCERYNVDHIAFKIVINNELLKIGYDKNDNHFDRICQEFTINFINKITSKE